MDLPCFYHGFAMFHLDFPRLSPSPGAPAAGGELGAPLPAGAAGGARAGARGSLAAAGGAGGARGGARGGAAHPRGPAAGRGWHAEDHARQQLHPGPAEAVSGDPPRRAL